MRGYAYPQLAVCLNSQLVIALRGCQPDSHRCSWKPGLLRAIHAVLRHLVPLSSLPQVLASMLGIIHGISVTGCWVYCKIRPLQPLHHS